MDNNQRLLILISVTLSTYISISKCIFDRVYKTLPIVVDELYHLPQGLEYCKQNFTHWDDKITTLPGMYILTAIFGQYFTCSTYNLRMISFVASCINFLMFVSLLKYIYFMEFMKSKLVVQAMSITLLPPLYFFSHVYYTDTLSVMFLLMYLRCSLSSHYKILSLTLGSISVMMRQTNIIWVALILGRKLFNLFISSSRVFGNQYLTNVKLSRESRIARDIDRSKLKRVYDLSELFIALKYHVSTGFTTVFKFASLNDWFSILVHSILLICFVIFVYINGSIVLGDKKAHEASLHLPQLLYFLLFYGVFGLPYVLAKLPSTLSLLAKNMGKVFIISSLMAVIVHFNTVVHPYLLADNRHFTFYIWNRWFGKYDFAVYATIPLYIFLLFSLYDNLKEQNCICFLLPYSVCLFLVLGLQKMIEIRYFLIPYLILRLRFPPPSYYTVLFEFAYYLAINAAAFNVFFSKKVMWADFDYPQRIIW